MKRACLCAGLLLACNPPVDSPPAAPVGLVAMAGAGNVTLRWDERPGLRYLLYWSTDPGASSSPHVIPGVEAGDGGWLHEDRAPGVEIFYVVTAVDRGQESPPSEEVSAIPTLREPAAPVAAAGSHRVTLSWTRSNPDAEYDVYWSLAGDFTAATPVVDQQTGMVHDGLENGTPYTYWLVTRVGALSSPPSAPVVATPVIDPPTRVRLEPEFYVVTVSWEPAAGAEAYVVYCAEGPGAVANGEAFTVVEPSFAHQGLAPATDYAYAVAAVENGAVGPPSAEATTRTLVLPDQEIEPNDSLAAAVTSVDDFVELGGLSPGKKQPFPVPGSLRGALHAGFDLDWYELAIPGDGWVTLVLAAEDPSRDLDFFVVEPSTLVSHGFAAARTDAPVEELTLPVWSGVRYLILINELAHTGEEAAYQLSATFVAEARDPATRDDSPSLATEIPVAADAEIVIEGTLEWAGDADWYHVDLPWQAWTWIEIQSPAGARYEASFYCWGCRGANRLGLYRTYQPVYQGGGVYPWDYEVYTYTSGTFAVHGGLKATPGPDNGFVEERYWDAAQPYRITLTTSPATFFPDIAYFKAGVLELSWNAQSGESYALAVDAYHPAGYLSTLTSSVDSPLLAFFPQGLWGYLGVAPAGAPQWGVDWIVVYPPTVELGDDFDAMSVDGYTVEPLAGNGPGNTFGFLSELWSPQEGTHVSLTADSDVGLGAHLRISRPVVIPAGGVLAFDAAVATGAQLSAIVRPAGAGGWTVLAAVSGGSDGDTMAVTGDAVLGSHVPSPEFRRVGCDLGAWAGTLVDVGFEYHADVPAQLRLDGYWIW